MRPVTSARYAPHLRTLREVSLIFHVKGTQEARLLNRLKAICRAEAAADREAALLALDGERDSASTM